MTRLGIAISGGPTATEVVASVKLAESLGYESAWMAEGHGGDQFAILAACASQTTTIGLGTSITSVFVRTVPTIAMAAATVDELSQGRFILGIGSSHRVQVEPEHGVAYGKPITRVREAVTIIRELLRAGQVQFAGETVTIENFDLWFRPYRPEIPIYAAALFPKMLAVCGEIADGVMLNRCTLDTAAEARRHIAAGAAKVGRDPSDIVITTLLPTAVADTTEAARDLARPGLALYAGFFPRYNKLLESLGFAAEASAIAEAWARGDGDAAIAAVSDAMVDATGIAGTPGQCRERLEAYRQSGIDLPIISPFARGPGAGAKVEAAIRACAPK